MYGFTSCTRSLAVQNTFNPFLPIVLNIRCYSNISHRGTSARCGQIRYSKRAVCLLLFRASILGYGWRRSANSKGNRSSPLYAICLNWITFLQCVGFDSNYSFTDVTVKLNRTGNIPRRGSGLSCRLSQPEAGSLTRFTASIIKHLMLHRKGDLTRQLSVGVFSVSLHLLARFYFSCPKFHHTTRAEYLPHNLWRPICFSI